MRKFDCSQFFKTEEVSIYRGNGFRTHQQALESAVLSNGRGLILPSILFFVEGKPAVEIPGCFSSACESYKDFIRAYRILKHFVPGILLIWRVYN